MINGLFSNQLHKRNVIIAGMLPCSLATLINNKLRLCEAVWGRGNKKSWQINSQLVVAFGSILIFLYHLIKIMFNYA